jgi:hypothetical protein
MCGLTLRITRRPASLKVDEKRRVGGRVHAVVRLRFSEIRRAPFHSTFVAIP